MRDRRHGPGRKPPDGAVVVLSIIMMLMRPIVDFAPDWRLMHLNATLGWEIPADTDAFVVSGGGWGMS